MEIGTLNQRIAFLEHSTKIDGIGNHKARWEEESPVGGSLLLLGCRVRKDIDGND